MDSDPRFINEERLRITLNSIGDAVIATDALGKVTTMNPVAEKLTGWTEAEAQGKDLHAVLNIINSKTREPALNPLDQVLTSGNTVGLANHTILISKNGTEYQIADSAAPIIDDNGTISGVVLVFHDVTEKYQGEEALRESETKFRALFEKGPIGVAYHKMIYDATGNPVDYFFIDANESYLKLTGVDPRGKTVTQAFPGIEKDPFDWIGTFGKVARTGETIRFEQYLALNDHWYDCVGYQYKPDHFVAAFLEITDRKKAEEALRLKNFVFNESIAANSIANLDGIITEANAMFLRIWGYTDKSEVIGKPIMYFLNDPTEAAAIVTALNAHGQWTGDYTAKRKDGSTFLAHSLAAFVRDEKGKVIGYQSSVVDITDSKRAEAELLKMQKLTSIGTLAGGIAHDFNNILMGLFGNLSLAKKEIAKDHPGFKPLNDAEKAMFRAIRLTQQLLTFSKGGEPIKEDVSLGALVEEVARFDLTGSNVKLVHHQVPDLWLAKADKGQIQQVISNLSLNAREAMHQGGHLYISLENAEIIAGAIPTLPQGKYIKITVKDEGTGIDHKIIDRIFDPYFTTKTAGSGLGLATTYSIITKHGGHINVVSELGRGTTFTVYLPASEARPFPRNKQPAEAPIVIKPSTKVLVLDDEDFICMVIPRWLKRLGCIVETTTNGQQAIALYKQSLQSLSPFDVLILDLTIPGGIGGQDVLREILAMDPSAKAIASSGYADGTVMSNYASYGFRGVLAKPYTETQLQELLEKVLL